MVSWPRGSNIGKDRWIGALRGQRPDRIEDPGQGRHASAMGHGPGHRRTDPGFPGHGPPLRTRGAADMIHVDVKKPGRIPAGCGWRADCAQNVANHRSSGQNLGFEYVHVAVDDHSL